MCHTQMLQKMIDAGGIVMIPDGNYEITAPLEVGDNTRIICSPNAVFRLADNANCPILTNRYAGPGSVTRNITIDGGVWDGNNTRQNRDAYTHPLYNWGQLICLTGTEDLTLINMTIKDPNSFGIQLTDTARFRIENIRFDCNKKNGNQDGVHVNGWARDGSITNLFGETNDDMVALNSDEGDFTGEYNDIENITIENIFGGNDGWTAVRLLSRKAHLRHITIRNIYGNYKYNVVSFTHWAEDANVQHYGFFDNITIENIHAASCRTSGIGHGGLIWFQNDIEHVGTVVINGLYRSEPAQNLNDVPTIDIEEGCNIDKLILTNVMQSIPDDKPLIRRHEAANVGLLTLDGVVQ